MTPSQTMPQPGDRLVAAIEAQAQAVAMTAFVVVVKAG
jgi:hypothetical protein